MSATARTAAKPISETEVEVVLTRVFDAPRALVFKIWTEPHHLAKWWGPRDFTNPVCELDVRVGGKILIHMHAPDGTVYPMTGTFRESRGARAARVQRHCGGPRRPCPA